ncbi:MAG: hypothetical protein COT33_00465 [Candidatus Nealsonbacteria bacterium CG08_land_8_20_14_0_20_38_20]|uniref:Uncharacterized protein n=1 Tax=Candidatus Nealsonbacteria bacterium CG08_land_8_20_14_0_20_38_20 TaxID=1974705 RepID=A0A2H0YML7_9BACT|nr:MAG: hypothetical protein COT33_00465 [Candidatus Nealsonbacteria bacterium CG08_land_8_20_14_0_20_38_20]
MPKPSKTSLTAFGEFDVLQSKTSVKVALLGKRAFADQQQNNTLNSEKFQDPRPRTFKKHRGNFKRNFIINRLEKPDFLCKNEKLRERKINL